MGDRMLGANDGLDLSNPEQARKYVADFKYILGKEASYAVTSSDRIIHFANMSDDDAVFVANELRAMEIEAKTRAKK